MDQNDKIAIKKINDQTVIWN